MQRKFLEDLGLDKETVDKIIDENGSDIEKARSKADTERDKWWLCKQSIDDIRV